MHAILRRAAAPPDPGGPPVVELDGIAVDTGRREVRLGGAVVPLATREFDLLAYLADNLGLALTRQQLLRGCGAPTGTATSGPSTSMSASCARNSARAFRWPPSGAWGTDWDETPAHHRHPRLVAATLVVTSIGSFTFIRRAALSTAQQELAGAGPQALSDTFSVRPCHQKGHPPRVQGHQGGRRFRRHRLVDLRPDGTVIGQLPSGLGASNLSVSRLLAGKQVNGHVGQTLVYTAVPTPIARATPFELVVVATRTVRDPASGLRYFLLVGAIALVLAAAGGRRPWPAGSPGPWKQPRPPRPYRRR